MALQDLTPQLRTRLLRVERLVGLFVAGATILLIAGFVYYIYHTAERKGWFVEKCPYHTYVATAEGLKVGDPVVLLGFSVGEITVIEAMAPGSWYKVFVGFEIRQPYYGYIWSDSKVKIASADFLGHRQIEVSTGYAGKPTAYEKNGRIVELLVQGKQQPLAKAPKGVFIEPNEEPALTQRAEKLLTQVESAVPNILSLTNQVRQVLDNTSTLMTNSSALVASLNQTIAQTQPVLSNITAITTNLRDPHGSLGDWVIPTDIHTNLTLTVGSVNTTITNANTQLLLLTTSLNQTLLNVAAITSNLNMQVQANDQILSEISDLVRETDDMLQGLKRHWLLKGAFPQQPGKETEKPILEPQLAPPKPGGAK